MPSFEYRPYEKGQELLDTRHWQFLLSSNTQADGKTGGFFFFLSRLIFVFQVVSSITVFLFQYFGTTF